MRRLSGIAVVTPRSRRRIGLRLSSLTAVRVAVFLLAAALLPQDATSRQRSRHKPNHFSSDQGRALAQPVALPQDGSCLPPNFHQIRKRLSKYDHCDTVWVTSALFTRVTRRYLDGSDSLDGDVSINARDAPPDGCHVALISPPHLDFRAAGWQEERLTNEELPFPGRGIRSAVSVKISARAFFPNASTVIYGDTKCNVGVFGSVTLSRPEGLVMLAHHNGRVSRIRDEFSGTWKHMEKDQAEPEVFEDIRNLYWYYDSLGILDTVAPRTDSMCVGWRRDNPRLAEFARVWQCEVTHGCRREQLSFPHAYLSAQLVGGDVHLASKSTFKKVS